MPHITGEISVCLNPPNSDRSMRFEAIRSFHRLSQGSTGGRGQGHSGTLLCLFLSDSFLSLVACPGSLRPWRARLIPFVTKWMEMFSGKLGWITALRSRRTLWGSQSRTAKSVVVNKLLPSYFHSYHIKSGFACWWESGSWLVTCVSLSCQRRSVVLSPIMSPMPFDISFGLMNEGGGGCVWKSLW